jgi:outer membrane biosynthesis protein TonB
VSVQNDPRLTAYALGELSSTEARQLEALLDHDARARAEVAAIREAACCLERELGAVTPALSARRRASILAAAAPGAAPLGSASPKDAVSLAPQRRHPWLRLAALALPAAAAVVMVQHRRSSWDGLQPAERARGTVDVAAERINDPRSPSPQRTAASSGAPAIPSSMPQPEPASDVSDEARAPQRDAPRAPERAAPPAELAPGVEQRLAAGDVDALARDEDEQGEADDIGSEAGVVGGVVGELVGGTAPPPVNAARPRQLTARAGQSLLAMDPNVAPYKVDLPEEYVQHGEEYHATISICVGADGAVSSVEILKPSIPIIDRQIPKVVPLWKYHPYLLDGKPTPFCYGTNYRVVQAP